MTDREKAIVMAYTGVVMLVGEKLNIFYEYCAELMGRPVFTHELGGPVANMIKERSKQDFLDLCSGSDTCAYCIHYRGHIQGQNRRGFAMCDVRGEIVDLPNKLYCPNWKERRGE